MLYVPLVIQKIQSNIDGEAELSEKESVETSS